MAALSDRSSPTGTTVFDHSLLRLAPSVVIADARVPSVGRRTVRSSEVALAEKGIWESHDLLADRTVKVAGQTYVHRHCQRCGRDFAIPPGERNWHAVHVGVFNFLLLDEPRNREWLSERCPGRPPAD